ncbi:MAG: polysaccharide lyase family 1 protein [Bacteroidales bacterium]|nr:polysaccharide lyase family 1 protein [Bacteroidales bacterium]
MRKIFTLMLSLLAITASRAELSKYDLNEPMGWATCKSMTTAGDYALTGGGTGKSITLKASGGDDYNAVKNAISSYSVIILDGSKGDFIMSKTLEIKSSNRTIVGINNARLCTKFYVTPEITKLMDDNNVKSLSTASGTGGTLSNGVSVGEARETKIRQLLIDYTGDSKESYRNSGIFSIKSCSNIIIRNIDFAGPGSIDVGGSDLVSISGANHIWVDHCQFTDGMDGNFDITNKADFVTVSWCVFKYTQRSYDHQNTNLVGGSDSASSQGEDNLNVTFVNNMWGQLCNARMPMARFGTIHLLNNYYNCAGCGSSVNPRKNSEFLIEGNYFEKGVKNIFSQSSAKSYVFKNNHYTESFSQPANKNSVNIPYAYTAFDVQEVPSIVAAVENGAGPTLTDPLTFGRTEALGAPVAAAYSYDGRFFRTEGAISLFDLNGKCLKTTENCLDMSAFSEGLYLLKSDAIVVKIKR